MSSPLSLFIPRVFSNISAERIIQTFRKLDYGQVNRVDFVEKIGETGKYKSAYIHFDYWYANDVSRRFQEKVRSDSSNPARIVYDDPWFWIVLENKLARNVVEEKDFNLEDDSSLEEDDASILDEEDEEMEQILDEMDETEAIMGKENFALVSADYVHVLESSHYNKRGEILRLQRKNDELRHALETEIYCLSYKEDEVADLQTQLAHFKELLAQYEPDVRFQNKELVQY